MVPAKKKLPAVRARILLLSLVGSVSYSFHFFFHIRYYFVVHDYTTGMVPAKKKLPALLRFSLLHFLFLFKKKTKAYIYYRFSRVSFSRAKDLLILCIKKTNQNNFFSSSQSLRYPKGWIDCGRKASFADSKLFAHLRCCLREMSECFSFALLHL